MSETSEALIRCQYPKDKNIGEVIGTFHENRVWRLRVLLARRWHFTYNMLQNDNQDAENAETKKMLPP